MKILIVCYGNACRSPMFAALLQKEFALRGIHAVVESAGVKDKEPTPASEPAQTVMREMGLDISGHQSRNVREVDLGRYDYIYCMEETQMAVLRDLGVPEGKLRLLNVDAGGVPNPWEKGLDAYRHCANLLSRIARDMASHFARLVGPVQATASVANPN